MNSNAPDAFAWMDAPLPDAVPTPGGRAVPPPAASSQVLRFPVPAADAWIDANGSAASDADTVDDREGDRQGGDFSVEAAVSSFRPENFAEWFVIAQTAIPALLFLPGSQSLRLPIRIGAYGIALFGLMLWWLRGQSEEQRHPATGWLRVCALWLGLMLTHPLTNSLAGGIGQVVLYVAVFSGVLWAPSQVDQRRTLIRVLALLLLCNGLNATVGVLQVYDPDRWMPRELSFAFAENKNALAAATYVGANGRAIVRPPGLFDTPGAVCGPGTVAALLGLIFALQPLARWKRAVAIGFSALGLAAIYLSHVRANFVITLGMMVVYAAILLMQRQRRQLATFATLGAAVLVVAFLGSSMLGGEAIAKRFSTLFDEDPRSLYYASRGQQLSTSFSELASQYPFGAGLARWGLMNAYFGDVSNLDSTPLWAEIQPTAWVIDGGLVFVALYGAALLAVLWRQLRLVRRLPDPHDRAWAAAVVAVNAGAIALVFSFVPFTTQVGVQFWFLEGALHGALGRRLGESS